MMMMMMGLLALCAYIFSRPKASWSDLHLERVGNFFIWKHRHLLEDVGGDDEEENNDDDNIDKHDNTQMGDSQEASCVNF